ncbi:DinB family protein [Lutibacter sp. B1]|uniref:DinB family protein n=1 Tax=Lutibacter sp. B1 TaxID=2725996 RepID=UPI00145641E0|nr:DinB family protein [Lutibacter sp. B1]NLP57438.1 DinB family protein [Lutibacter sp. B1]
MNSLFLPENEYAPYYKQYIGTLKNVDLLDALETSLNEILKTTTNLSDEKLTYRYAEDKWTIKQLIQHLIDTERILSYRALRFSRNDATEIHGFDENWYVNNSNGNDRDFKDLLEELTFVRKSSISLFKSFTDEMLALSGTANGSDVTVRALGFIIAGHQTHHLNIIKERYL